MSGNSSANYLIEINQIYTTHEAIVCTKCRRAFEGLDLPAALTIYSVFSNKRQSWHKWYNFFILHWPNKIWLTGLYLVKHSPCSPFFKHIISEFQPFRLVLIALYINILYFSLNITNNFGALYLLSMHSIQYPLGLSLNWVAMIELTTAFCVVGRSHISLGIKNFLIFSLVNINVNDEVMPVRCICQYEELYLIFVRFAIVCIVSCCCITIYLDCHLCQTITPFQKRNTILL